MRRDDLMLGKVLISFLCASVDLGGPVVGSC